MKTTLGELKSFKPCLDEYKKLCKLLGTNSENKEVSILEILNILGAESAYWALRTQKYIDYCLILAAVAESVLHVFEKEHPNDNRPRKAIEGIRLFQQGKITRKELEVLGDAAYYAYVAADVGSAAYVAADVGSAVVVAHAVAAIAAGYAAVTNARKKQWELNEEILRKYLEG